MTSCQAGILFSKMSSICHCSLELYRDQTQAFRLQLLEWWYTSAEHKLASQQKLPIPPPPPLLAPHPNGVSLPSDPAHCPLCRHKRTNPAMAVPTGYVFCYPCIFNHISQFGCCPVTRIPANVDQIRRLYQSQ